MVVVSDASLSGFGFYVESLPNHSFAATWPSACRPGSGFSGSYHPSHHRLHASNHTIAVCELLAVVAAASTLGELLRNRSVRFVLDNSSDVGCMNKQSSSSPGVTCLLRRLFDLADEFNFNFSASHRPGEENVLADFLSRPELHHFDFVNRWQMDFAHRSLLPLFAVTLIDSRHVVPQRLIRLLS